MVSSFAVALRTAKSLTTLTLAAMLLASPHTAAAPRRLVQIPHPVTMLLRDAGIHRELGLQPEQTAKIQVAVDQIDQPLWRLRDLPADRRNEPARELLAQLREKLATILSDRQQTRLDELVFQAMGMEGLLEPGTANRLKLSAEQVRQIDEVIAQLVQQVALLQQGDADDAKTQEQARKRIERAQSQIMTILEPRQRQALPMLPGRPYDLSRVPQRACRAPELRQAEEWINGGPVKLADLRGSVVIVHFYTFGCINCVRNLPHYVDWQDRFASEKVRIVGIHRPETQRERSINDVRKKAAEAGLKHPIAVDNASANWNAWGNNIWPAVYLVDKQGFVRYWWYGELNWQGAKGEEKMRTWIRDLLAEESNPSLADSN